MLALLLAAAAGVAAVSPASPDVELFTREGCPHCVEAHAALDEVAAERAGLTVAVRDVVADPTARDRLKALARQAGVGAVGVPTFYVRGQLLVGVASRADAVARLRAVLDGGDGPGAEAGLCSAEEEPAPCAQPPDAVRLPLVGEVSSRSLGLPLFTVVVGLLDGFNPCATWVLLFLLSLLVNLKSRAKMAAVGGTFVAMSGVVYFAFMAAWLSFFFVVGISRVVTVILGLIAVFVGAVNVKDYFAFHKGLTLSIPERAKPGIYRRVRRVLAAENLAGALVAVTGLAFLVNLVELLCTAGLPAVYTAVLASHQLPRPVYYAYLGLYNVAYVLDDSILLLIAVVTLSKRKLQEGGGRLLKLLSGAVMLALGIALLVAPGWLGW